MRTRGKLDGMQGMVADLTISHKRLKEGQKMEDRTISGGTRATAGS